ncbi:Splicing factor [Coemansia sp. RSA 1646]|nr:Splicing factor [Coemansia sp. RSA 1646]
MSEELEALNSLEEFMGELPEKLDKTPYDYNTYIRWIELLRRVGDIESMRVARTAMSSRLAVPEDVWTEWIHDERSREPEDGLDDVAKLTKLKDLFSDAVNEYASSSMWQKYIDFVKELDDSGHNSVRVAAGEVFGHSGFVLETLEQAASATKAHYRDSQAIWLQYKNQLERCIGKASENESDRNGFVDKLQTAFLERLEQPHTEIEDTFNMYSEFVTKNFADSEYESRMVYATKIVGSTRTKCSKREWLEDNVSASGGSWYGFSLYIDKLSREKQTDIQEIFCLFERALVQNYCYPEVWDEYITFVAFSSSNDSSDALRVASRAIRNCPCSATYDPTPNLEAAQDTTDTVSSRNSKEASSANPAAAVFVSNLPTSYKETQLIELLGGARCVDKVELLRDQDGSFRGQAKVDLKSTNALVAALDKNGFRLENQHISIHIFKKHYQSTRQVSVMVKGFSPETGNKKIENVAKAAGGFVRIRRNQQGDVAHVVMRSMGDAVRAASALNGCIVDGHTLEADIPDLPEESDVSSTKPAKVATQKQQGTAQNRTTTSLIPRKMAVPSRRPAKRVKIAKPNADILESTRKDIANEPKDGSHTSTEPSTSNKKSNDEFRQMFLKHN